MPQIAYSAFNGTKHSYSLAVLLGLSLVRLFVPLYFFACPDNFTRELVHYVNPAEEDFSTTSTPAAVCAVVWTAVQVIVLCLQQRFGPRFFVPARFLPVRYNYHRPVPSALLQQRRGDEPRQHALQSGGDPGVDEDDERGLLLTPVRRLNASGGRPPQVSDRDLETGREEEENQIECVICCSAVSTSSHDQGNHDTEYMVRHAECLTKTSC